MKFELDQNGAVFLSSKIDDNLPGRIIRGFKILCTWKGREYDNVCQYVFIIRTDDDVTHCGRQ